MAERRAAITGALGRTADPEPPDNPIPASPTVRALALRVGFWILIVLGGIYTISTASWRHDGVVSIRAAFWAIVMVNAIWQAWRRFEELRELRRQPHAVPHRRS
jgi:hypothetical protein